MSKTNIFSLPFAKAAAPIQDGDAVLIIRKGGEVVPMTVGVDQSAVDAMRNVNPQEMTPEQIDLAMQGQTLFLLSMAANNEAIMTFLAKVASVPGETDLSKLSSVANAH